MPSASALAETYPTKPIRVIVPAAAGSGSDVQTRMVVSKLAERMKVQVVVENRTGAGAIVGVNYLKNAPPDGYTIGILQSANTVQPWLVKDMPFDIRKDFAPLMLEYTVPLAILVPASSPLKSVADIPAYANANPGKVFYGTTGMGATGHLSAELFKQVGRFDMTPIHFKGTPELINSALGGNIHMYFDAYAASKAMVDSGRLRVLAVTSKQRMSSLPNVPILAESFPGFEVMGWVGLAAPRDTPREIVDKLSSELMAVMQLPEVRNAITAGAGEPSGIGSAEFASLIIADTEKWGRVTQAAGMKKE